MGSDSAPDLFLQAIVAHLHTFDKHLQPVIIAAPHLRPLASSLPFHVAKDVIEMEEPPLLAWRKKKHSSMHVGLRLLKEGDIDAFISMGNTGALVAGASMTLSTLPHLHRPALVALMPTQQHAMAVLDVGAQLSIASEQLLQFAYLGATYQKIRGMAHPTVGLLNIGSEPSKGTLERRAAYNHLIHLTDAPFRFIGNIEGKSAFEGTVDVLLTDGFTGNVFLKTAEGMAGLILNRFHALASQEEQHHLSPLLGDLQRHLSASEYPGAPLLGVQGLVIKCHGSSHPTALLKAIREAGELVSNHFFTRFRDCLKSSLEKDSPIRYTLR